MCFFLYSDSDSDASDDGMDSYLDRRSSSLQRDSMGRASASRTLETMHEDPSE